MENVVFKAIVGASVILWFVAARRALRYRKRRKSLWQDGASWVWTEFDGSERRSDIHPDAPGGAWENDPAFVDAD